MPVGNPVVAVQRGLRRDGLTDTGRGVCDEVRCARRARRKRRPHRLRGVRRGLPTAQRRAGARRARSLRRRVRHNTWLLRATGAANGTYYNDHRANYDDHRANFNDHRANYDHHGANYNYDGANYDHHRVSYDGH